MSPPWRDDLTISLAPRKVALVRRARGLRRRVLAAAELAVPEAAFADLGPVLARLVEALSDRAWQGAAARVVVGHPWTCFAVAPWPRGRLDAAARLAHARFLLEDAWGEGMADWSVTLADTPPGRPLVACAIPGTLRGALEAALAPARLALVSLRPQLVVAFEGWRHRLPAEDAWFVRVDDTSISAVHLDRGAWDHVHAARLAADWRLELQRLQAFARVMREHGPGRMYVDAPAWMRRGAAATEGIEWLEGVGVAESQELAPPRRVPA